MATEYVFHCPACDKSLVMSLDPFSDDLARGECPACGGLTARVFTPVQIGYIDWVNPNKGDGINMGLPIQRDARGRIRNFGSAREREDYAKANGYEKLDR